ncbi:MAG: hypothetical protein OWS74_07540, partial [Firmicutes bacterium]|nr:hypothetical protein [Bacillota bacterium]
MNDLADLALTGLAAAVGTFLGKRHRHLVRFSWESVMLTAVLVAVAAEGATVWWQGASRYDI